MIPTHASLPVDQLVISDPMQDSYEEFVASMTSQCRCQFIVCPGVLAGGICDSWGDLSIDATSFDDSYEAARDEEEEEFPL